MVRGDGARERSASGFTLFEVLVGLLVTMVVMSAVFLLLQKGQASFEREPEVAEVTANARAGLDRISREVTIAGFQTPPSLPVFWENGGGQEPDVLTIVYGDPNVPVARPRPCSGRLTSERDGGVPPVRASSFGPLPVLSRVLDVVAPGIDPEILLPSEWTDGDVALQKRRRESGGEYRRRRAGSSGDSNPAGRAGQSPVPCGEVGRNSTLALDPWTVLPQPIDFEATFPAGMELIAIQGPRLDDTSCDGVPPAIVALTVTDEPVCSGTGGPRGSSTDCGTLNVDYEPRGPLPGVTLPAGFDTDVNLSCAVVGMFHVVQYRIHPPPSEATPVLERRDLLLGTDWEPLAHNIENLQVQYVQGPGGFEDVPSRLPMGSDPDTFITKVRISISARSSRTDLQGGSAGVFAAADTHLRKTFSTTLSLRNQLTQAQEKAEALGRRGWN